MADTEGLHCVLGDLDSAKVLEILELSPTVAEVELASMWAEGQGDIVDRSGRALEGKVARIP